jgi:hypothetical protein
MSDTGNNYDRMPLALAILLAAFLGVGLAAGRFTTSAANGGSALPDLSGAHIAEIRNASGRTILSGEFRDRTDSLGNTEKDAALVDSRGRRVIGEVEIEIPGPNAMQSAQELEIDIIEVEPNAKHALFIDDREIATFTTDDRGSIDIEVESVTATPSTAPR